MHKKLLTLLILSLMVLSSSGEAKAQAVGIEKRLKDDIEIMETVLNKIFASDNQFFPSFNSNCHGFYLKDYGVIFNIRHNLPISELQILMIRNMERQLRTIPMREEQNQENEINFNKRIGEIKDKIAKFLGNYASSMRELQSNDKIAVVVDLDGTITNFGKFDEKIPHQIIASVSMKDLQDYRQEKISQTTFRKRIRFDEVAAPSEDISIFTKVIHTAMTHAGRKGKFNIAGEVQGIRFPGHGVLFLTSIDFSSPDIRTIELEKIFGQQDSNFNVTIKKSQKPDYQEQLEAMQQKFIDLLSNYGHTLRNLKPNDWVEFAVNFRNVYGQQDFSRGIIKVKKKTIDDFNRKKLDFNQFKKAVKVIYY